MKYYLLLALAAVSAALISCEPAITGVRVDSSNLSFPGEGGTQTLKVKAGTAWEIAVPADLNWLTVSPKSGTSSADVTVTASPNKMKDQDRSVELVINYEGNQIRVNVDQSRAEGEPVFTLSKNSIDADAEGGEFSVTVVSDGSDYDVESNAKWITVVSREGNRYDGETLRFSVAPNEKKEARSGVLSVCTKNGTCNPVTVNQAAFSGATYEHLNVAFRYTATWCGHCPYMDETFHMVKDRRDDFDFVTIHGSAGYPLYFNDSNSLMSAFQVGGFPTGIINGWKEFSNSHNVSANADNLEGELNTFEKTFSCLAGVSVNSTAAADGKITVNAEVETSISGGYQISAFLLESGIVEAQTYFPDNGPTTELKDFVHDNVARATLTASALGDAFNAVAGEKTSFSWSVTPDKSWNAKNLSVAVLVHRAYGDVKKNNKKYPDYYVANAALAPIGKSVEMKYEK